jgi:hypothetical protein
MADAHRRKFDVVIVWKFDRFARSVSYLPRALEIFNALGISFVSLSEQMDTTTSAGKMVFTVLGAVAELERSLIAERVRAGLRNARAKGRPLGAARLSSRTLFRLLAYALRAHPGLRLHSNLEGVSEPFVKQHVAYQKSPLKRPPRVTDSTHPRIVFYGFQESPVC